MAGDRTGRTQARVLVSMLRETAENFFTPQAAELAREVAEQLEAQLPPPKPDEPQGLGAVVEDADGALWVLRSTKATKDRFESSGFYRNYDKIRAVRVLSEGVTA